MALATRTIAALIFCATATAALIVWNETAGLRDDVLAHRRQQVRYIEQLESAAIAAEDKTRAVEQEQRTLQASRDTLNRRVAVLDENNRALAQALEEHTSELCPNLGGELLNLRLELAHANAELERLRTREQLLLNGFDRSGLAEAERLRTQNTVLEQEAAGLLQTNSNLHEDIAGLRSDNDALERLGILTPAGVLAILGLCATCLGGLAVVQSLAARVKFVDALWTDRDRLQARVDNIESGHNDPEVRPIAT